MPKTLPWVQSLIALKKNQQKKPRKKSDLNSYFNSFIPAPPKYWGLNSFDVKKDPGTELSGKACTWVQSLALPNKTKQNKNRNKTKNTPQILAQQIYQQG
jgi:hypothetical protein